MSHERRFVQRQEQAQQDDASGASASRAGAGQAGAGQPDAGGPTGPQASAAGGESAGAWEADASLMDAMGLGAGDAGGGGAGGGAGQAAGKNPPGKPGKDKKKKKKPAKDAAASDPGAPQEQEQDEGESEAEDEAAEQAAARSGSASGGAQPDAGDSDVQARAIQRMANEGGTEGIQQAAQEGVSGPSSTLPHLGAIQASFGQHDVSGVQAHVGGAAATASEAIGAEAYATGNNVAFRESPDLFTAAHEATHVVQQRAGVQLLGGVGEAGDQYEQQADAVASLVVQGKSAEALLGQASGGGGGAAVQRWTAGVPKKNEETSVWKYPMYTEAGIETAPDVVLSSFKSGFVPSVYFNIRNGFDDRGDFYVDFTGASHKRTKIPNNEEEWQTPQAAKIGADDLTDPGKGKYNEKGTATIYSDYKSGFMDDSVDVKSPETTMNSYHDAFMGTANTSKTESALDVEMGVEVASGAIATGFTDSWTQSTAVTASKSTSVNWGNTLTSASKTGIGVAGKGSAGGQGKPGGEVGASFSQEWTDTEADSYASAAGSGWSETATVSKTITVSSAVPKGFKGAVMLYPFTTQRLDWVKSRKHDKGLIKSDSEGDETRWVGYNVPAGSLPVLGADPKWLLAVDKKLDECRALHKECTALDRKYASATGPAKEKLALKLEEAKAKLRAAIDELDKLPYSIPDARTAAKEYAKQAASPSTATAKPTEVDALSRKMGDVDDWTAYSRIPVK